MNWYWSVAGRVAAGAGSPRRRRRPDRGRSPPDRDRRPRPTLHVAVRPGQDWAFLLGVLKVVFDEGWDRPATAVPVAGVERRPRALAAEADLADLSARCDVPVDVIADVARRFATARTAFCATATGVGQTRNGTVGGVARDDAQRRHRPARPARRPPLRARHGRHGPPLRSHGAARASTAPGCGALPMVAGYHSLPELADEITTPGPGQIRAVILNAGNPVVSGPQGAALDAALAQLDLLVGRRPCAAGEPPPRPLAHPRHPLAGARRGASDPRRRSTTRRSPSSGPPPSTRRPGCGRSGSSSPTWPWPCGRNLFGKPGVNRVVRATRALARRTGRPGLAFHPDWVARLDDGRRPAGVVEGRRRPPPRPAVRRAAVRRSGQGAADAGQADRPGRRRAPRARPAGCWPSRRVAPEPASRSTSTTAGATPDELLAQRPAGAAPSGTRPTWWRSTPTTPPGSASPTATSSRCPRRWAASNWPALVTDAVRPW